MVRLLVILILLTAACSDEPQVLLPNDATEFSIWVFVNPAPGREDACESGPTSGSRHCVVRYTATVINVGEEPADAGCFITFHDPEGHRVWGGDLYPGTIESGQSAKSSGTASFIGALDGPGEARCAAYPPGSTANIG